MLSKKLKAQLKRIATSTILAVSTVAVLFGVSANLDSIVNTVREGIARINGNEIKAENEVDVIKDSSGISIKVNAEDSTGIRKIEVLQGSTSVEVHNYDGSKTEVEQAISVSVPFGETKTFSVKVNGNTIKQQEITNMRCISTAQDMVNFRNLVNAGNSFEGKYVELTNDIDLSSVCSATNGSWQSIGTYANSVWYCFSGIFNGNNYQIKNLYINNTSKDYQGLFGLISGGIIENLSITGNITVRSYSGGICGEIRGTDSKIINCKNYATITSASGNDIAGICGFIGNATNVVVINCENYATISRSGSANGYHYAGIVGSVQNKSTNVKILNCKNTGNVSSQGDLAGILGYIRNSTDVTVDKCCNFGTIKSVDYCPGGIVGNICDGGKGVVTNCYNKGTINAGKGSMAGIVANLDRYDTAYATPYVTIKNCYNSATIQQVGAYGAILGYSKANTWYALSNNYFETGKGATYAIGYYNTNTGTTGVAAATLKGYANNLGANNWVADSYGINNGYPILRWQIPQMELNVKQTYMNVGDTLQLTVDKSKSPVTLGNITWASMDSSIASIDSTGKVTAVGEGYTTVYAIESTYTLKAMAIINVAKSGCIAFAQTNASNGTTTASAFTAVLKEDGTVWTAGCNSSNQLGNGTSIDCKEFVQVKTDNNHYLTNVVKISVGKGHTLALTKDGYVYAWGQNSYSKLGTNDTNNRCYATKVLDSNGDGFLSGIVDISAGNEYSSALGADGTSYMWGLNSAGQLGVGNTTTYYVPQITLADKGISVAIAADTSSVLHQNGGISSWGYNISSEAGLGNTTTYTFPQILNFANATEVKRICRTLIARNVANDIYVAGNNVVGQYGNGTTTYASTLTKTTVPSSSSVKYIGGSGRNIILLLQNGTIWTSGNNTYGQISNGATATSVTNFTQAKNRDGSYIANAKNIGLTFSGCATLSDTIYVTTTYVDDNGYVYGAGNNTYGQFGNGTTSTSSTYYTRMGVPYLNYLGDDIVIGVGENYVVNRNNFRIEEFNVSIDYNGKAPGTLVFSSDDTNITVDSTTGKVTGISEGYARVKVTDTTNNYETYITVKVVNDNGEKLEVGSKFSVGLRTNGEVWTWGSNTYGELGIDSVSEYEDEPVQIETLNEIVDIGAGNYHAVALDRSGNVYVWGLNNAGQIGNDSTTNEKKPIKVNGLSNIVKVDAYKNFTTALDSSGNLYAWGEGYDKTPQIIFTNVKDIQDNVMLTQDRRIMRLDGTLIPVAKNIVKLSANETTVVAIKDNGQVISIDNNYTVTSLSVTNAVDVRAGNGFYYILDKNGNVYSYGTNSNGELGNGANATVNAPTKINNLSNVEEISAGEGNHGAIGTFDGSIYVTGLNDKGQLGHGNIDNKNTFEILLNVAIESNVDKVVEQIGESQVVDIGLDITLNLKKDLKENSTSEITIVDDTVASLTKNGDGTYNVTGKAIGRTFLNATIAGNINGEDRQFATNVEVRVVPEGGITIPQIKSGEDFTIALKANGEVETWGKNIYGQLGVGNTENYDEPQLLESLDETIVEIAVGNNHVLALTEEGNIYGWGLNDKGQVGNGTNANQLSKATVINIYGNELSKIIRVEAHGDNSFAINEDGEVWAWGKDFGKRAKKLSNLENVIDVSTSYFVKADGTAYNMDTLEKLTIVGTVRAMDEGTDHSVFLTTEGKAYAIGSNDYGQLGNGSTDVASTSVVAIRKDENNLLENIVSVEAGDRYTIILTSDGSVYTTGLNENGKLGVDLSTISVVTPIKNNNITDAMLISAGNDHAVVAKKDGKVYSWGKGNVGQLGNRAMKDSVTPVMVGPYIIRTDKKNIVLGKTDSCIVKGRIDYFNILKEENIDISSISKNTQIARISKLSDNASELTDEDKEKGYKAFKVEAIKQGTTNVVLTENKTNTNGILQIEVLPEPGITISPMVETVSNFTVTLKTNGTVWTYGQNTYGELGIGTNEMTDEPKQVEFGEGVVIKQIAVGEFHSVALDTEGNVWAWGRNNYYQLGNNGSDSNIPVKVTGIPKVTRITSGTNSVMAVTEDNKLVVWGQNAYGELGTGSNTNKITPTIVNGIHDVLDVQGGKNHYLLLKTTGEIYSVGSNLYSQLGIDLGERTRINTFEKIPSNLKFGFIAAGWTSSAAITVDGTAYVWGQNVYGNLGNGTKTNIEVPTQVSEITGVVEADIGKTHTILRDYNDNIYLAGINANGQLGDGTTENGFTFVKNLNLDDVLRVSAGNTYTAVMKKDGTVWAWGDYNHGNRVLRARTNSKVPVQIGSDTSSLDKLEIVIKKSEVESILANSEFRFNLIYEDENKTSDFSYESLNTEIAEVNQDGNVLGIREGSTWVKVTDNETGKVSVAIIRVIDNVEGYTTYTSPKVVTGEDFVATLKEDGNIDIWGYDESQMVDSDVPYTINVVATYQDIAAGRNHIIALRKDGTVWTAGSNEYGQLGKASSSINTKLTQVQNLSYVQKIAAGDNFCVAMDSYGITYVWGEGFAEIPQVLDTNIRSVSYLAAGGKDQIVMVLPTGEVYGIGSILNGTIKNFDKAVKVEVGEDNLLILDTNGSVYTYKNGVLTKANTISNAIDISVDGNVNMYQKVNEKVFVWGENEEGQLGIGDRNSPSAPVQPVNNSSNVYTISAGRNNTYIVDTNGFVYASGANNLGQIGNGTKEKLDSTSYQRTLTHTIVGTRAFDVEPLSSIMEVNDVEEFEVIGNTYNVFKKENTKDLNEFNITVENGTILELLEESGSLTGKIKALAEGLTTIDVTDKVTGEVVTATRKVVPMDQNRILTITADGVEADAITPSDEETYIFGYNVNVPMDDDETRVNLIIEAKDSNDNISIDNGVTLTNGNILNTTVEIPESETSVTIPVSLFATNGTEFRYELVINRISNNNNADTVTVNGYDAIASVSEEDVYEIVVTDLENNDIVVKAKDPNANVSIRGKIAEVGVQSLTTEIPTGRIEVPFKIISESGKVRSYILRIYTKEELLKLKTLKVNNELAKLEDDGTYSKVIADDVSRCSIYAKAKYDMTYVGINESEKELSELTKTQVTPLDENNATIELQTTAIIDGVEQTISKTYNLKIYKNKIFSFVDEVQVNGEITEEENNTFVTYVLSNVNEANIQIRAKESTYKITMDGITSNGTLTTVKELPNEENTFTFKVENDEGDTKTYTLRIVRGVTDTSIKKITVGSNDYVVEAEKTDEVIDGREVYEAKVLSKYTNVDVTVQTVNKYGRLDVNNTGAFKVKIATENMNINNKETLVPIIVLSPDEATSKNYYLRIVQVEDDTSLEKVWINELLGFADIDAVLENALDDTRYEVHLENPVTEISVSAKATNEYSKISINNEAEILQNSVIDLDITESVTEIPIKVTSEAGTVKTYYLTIYTISDDCSIENVTVNGNEATWNQILGRYEIKVDRDLAGYEVELTSTNVDAKVSVNGTESVHQVTKQVVNEGEETIVNLKVTAPNTITSSAKKLAIIEKSNNTGLGYVKVNGKALASDENGNYNFDVVSSVQSVLIEVGAQDANAKVSLDNDLQEKVWKGTKVLQTDEEIYDVYIIAEDGVTTGETFTITITRLDGNTDIDNMEVTYVKNSADVTKVPEKQEDGTYYLELPKLDEDRVALRISLKKGTSKVNVLGTEENGGIYGYVNLAGEITNVPIKITAEDGTIYETTLVLEKESNDTSLKELSAEGYVVTKTDSGYKIIVDSKVDKLNITAVPKKTRSKVKLSNESDYVSKLENKEVTITGLDEVLFNVLAEDGETTGIHSMQILRTYDTSLDEVTVNGDTASLGTSVNIIDSNPANIEIIAKNDDAEIYLMQGETTIASGVGNLTTTQTISEENVSTYLIKVQGPDEYSNYSKEYTLKVRKKSSNTSALIWLDLDNNYLEYNNETGKYEAVVVGGNHTIGVQPESTYADITIEDENTFMKQITIGPKETKTYTITITAEDGTEKEYDVAIYRKNNDTSIDEVKLKLDESSEENILTEQVDGSYYYKVPRRQNSVIVTLTTTDSNATAVVSTKQAISTVKKEVEIDQNAEITNVPLNVIAEDGTENTVNLKIERESNDTTLKEVEYDGKVISQDENETYTIDVDNRLTQIQISAIPNHSYAKLKVIGNGDYVSTLTQENVDIDGVNYFEIEVIAEDNETTKTYRVNLNRIFSTKVTKVEVDTEEINPSGTNYSTFVDTNAENHLIKVIPDNDLAIVTIYDNEDNELTTGVGTITLTDDFEETSKAYKVKVQGPSGFEEFEAEYLITLNKKSTDTSAKVYINDVEITKDEVTGKYNYITKASSNIVKLITTNEYAKVSIDERPSKVKTAEQAYVINIRDTKEITAIVISQNGEEEEYNIVITRLDNNVNITGITVNDTMATKVAETMYRSAQDPFLNTARVVIKSESELTNITAMSNEVYYDGSIDGKLEFDVWLPGSGTTEVQVTLTAQDGTKKQYTLNIVQNVTENLNLSVKVNNLEADKLDDSSYRIFVENTLTSSEVNIKAEDEFTIVKSGLYEANEIRFTKELNTTGDITTVAFEVYSETGTMQEYMLYIIKESNDNSIQKLYVNGIEITKGDNGRYTTYIDNTEGDPTVKVKANNEYAYVRIGTNERELQESTKVVKLGEERTTTVQIMVYAQSGVLNTEYLDIITTFAVGNIDSLIVDDVEVTNYDETTRTFTAMVENNINLHEIQVIADNNYVTLELADAVGIGSVTSTVSFEEGEEIKTLTLYVTGETDLTQTYTIVIAQKSNNVNLSQVKVNDVTLEEEAGHVYVKNIDMGAKKVKIEVTAEYPYATVKVGDTEVKTGASGIVWLDIEVTQDEITIPVVTTAADGTTVRTYNIILTRKPSLIKGNIITDNWEDIHIANIYVYRTADKRKIDDEDDPRELVYYTKSKEDGSYVLELPNADNYDVIFKKDGYLETSITNITAKAYSSVRTQTIKLDAGDVDSNGEIELDDLVELNEHIGEVLTSANKVFDLNEDGIIDSKDRALIKNNYHKKTVRMEWIDGEEVSLTLPLGDGYVITSEYGYRVDPFDGSTKFHSGIDLVGEHHGNIYAVESGEVTYVGVQSGYGNCIEIKHIVDGVTIYSFYAHLSEIDVNVGDYVTQGSIIGLEGGAETDPNHGTSTGHHLHFEIRSESGSGHSLNPHDYITFSF